MESNETHTASSVTSVTLNRHVTSDVRTIFDVGCFTEWSICTRYVVVVTSDHDRSDLALANEFIEFQSNVDTAHTILIEDTSLGTNHQLVLFSIANPVVVVAVLVATSWIDRFHRCMVSCNQVFVFTAEADPTEWTITIVKEHRSHDIFYIRWPNEAVLVIQTILRNFLDA